MFSTSSCFSFRRVSIEVNKTINGKCRLNVIKEPHKAALLKGKVSVTLHGPSKAGKGRFNGYITVFTEREWSCCIVPLQSIK